MEETSKLSISAVSQAESAIGGGAAMDKVRKNKRAILVFMMPALVLFLGIIILPIFFSAYYSLLDWDGITQSTFVGLENYKKIFTVPTLGLTKALRNMFILAGLSLFVQLPIALFLALLIAKGIKGERFFVSAFFIPVIMSTVVIGQLWLKMYNPEYGIINTLLKMMGLGVLCRTWLGDKETVLAAVFIPMVWQYIGYHMLLMYAGIKSINGELLEAARIDGASYWQGVRHIMLPLLKPVLRMCTIFAVTGAFKSFDLIYVLTGGGPSHASEVPSSLMFTEIFSKNHYGVGSSIAILIIFLCFFFAILIKKAFHVEEV